MRSTVGGHMKKIYSTPAVQMNGSVVSETRISVGGRNEPAGFNRVEGSIGFNL
jgi:hypothetical protein